MEKIKEYFCGGITFIFKAVIEMILLCLIFPWIIFKSTSEALYSIMFVLYELISDENEGNEGNNE